MPNGYDGTRPPPPPGYAAGPNDAQYAIADQRYAQNAESWARDNCVKSRGNVAGGAAVGGILGALIGGALGGRHDRGAGVLAGAAVGAVGGAAVASSTGGETSPGCPPGFVTRGGAVAYSYQPEGYYYAAPGWYRPWVYIDNSWVYRPYPYHDYYYRTWRGGYGRPGWHGGPPAGTAAPAAGAADPGLIRNKRGGGSHAFAPFAASAQKALGGPEEFVHHAGSSLPGVS
jgi:hypothetical protein